MPNTAEDRSFPVDVVCQFCKKKQTVMTVFEHTLAWEAGELIQRAMPYLSADERELLISGTCKKCWSEVMSNA